MAFSKPKNKRRYPVTGPLRRQPGQSVREELERIMEDQVTGYLFVMVVLWLLFFWELVRRWLTAPFDLPTLGMVASAGTIYCFWRILRLRRDVRNLVQADKAERRVGELLRKLRDKDYVTFDDLIDEEGGSKTNIDHVVVGPSGVYSIETKGYSIYGSGLVEIDETGALKIGGKGSLKNVIGQAKSSAVKVSKHLNDCLQRKYWVEPVLIFPGWKVKPPKAEIGVTVLDDTLIAEYFGFRPRTLSNEEIRDICSHLDRSARS